MSPAAGGGRRGEEGRGGEGRGGTITTLDNSRLLLRGEPDVPVPSYVYVMRVELISDGELMAEKISGLCSEWIINQSLNSKQSFKKFPKHQR